MSQEPHKDSGFLEEKVRDIESDKDSSGFLEDKVKEIDGEKNGSGFLQDKVNKIEGEREELRVEFAPEIYYHTSEQMEELNDESVHFAITSPPYNAGWDYGSIDDSQDYATEYLPMLARVFEEVYRVLVPGGRFCVNVPSLLRSGAEGGFPISSDICRMMASDDVWAKYGQGISSFSADSYDNEDMEDISSLQTNTDWVIREQISWIKGFNTDGLAPNGSFPRPWGVLLNNMHEVIIVFQKPGTRDFSDMSEERIERSKIDKKRDDMCDDVWEIHPDSWSPQYTDDEDIPVFPERLVRRAIRLWTYREDTVLDPFAGRFTTGKVAKQEGRYSVGYEIREDLEKDINEYVGKNQSGLGRFM